MYYYCIIAIPRLLHFLSEIHVRHCLRYSDAIHQLVGEGHRAAW
jgi:hypothetical protein